MGTLLGIGGVAGLPAEELLPGIVNASFELCTLDDDVTPCASGAGQMPDGWTAHEAGEPGYLRGVQGWTTEKAHTGLASWYANDPAHGWWFTGLNANPVVAVPGITYVLSSWVLAGPQSTPDSRIGQSIQFYDADGERLLGGCCVQYGVPLSQTEWREMVDTATAPAGAASVGIQLYSSAATANWGRGGMGDFYVDDVTLLPAVPALPVG